MAILTVLSENLNPSTGNLSSRFVRANGFYIDAPLIAAEIEIDVALQVYFPIATGERIRKIDLGKLKNGEIKLNETDSETLVIIPKEFVDTGLEMALYFTPSDTTFIEVFIVGADCTLCGIKAQIDQLETKVNNDFNVVNQTLSQIQSTLNQILTAVSIDVVVPGTVDPEDTNDEDTATIEPVAQAATPENYFIFL